MSHLLHLFSMMLQGFCLLKTFFALKYKHIVTFPLMLCLHSLVPYQQHFAVFYMRPPFQEAWIKFLLLPMCCLPLAKRRGRHHKPINITMLSDLWSRGQFGVLWHLTQCHSKLAPSTTTIERALHPRLEYAISLAREGLYLKACQILYLIRVST